MAGFDPIAIARDATRSAIVRTFGAREPGAVPIELAPVDDDPGMFGPDSVTWQVHGNLSMLVGGLRALFLQTLHPLAMAGVAQHSRYRTDPLGRLARTASFVGTTTYGTTAEAEAAIHAIRRVHARVRGTAPDGRAYSADDPDLLAWVHHTEVESFLLAYQRIGPGLSSADADRYVAEMAGLGARLGVVDPLTTAADVRAWIREHPERRVTAEARAAARFLIAPPLPLALRPPYTVVLGAAISLMPLRPRLELGLVVPGPISGRLAWEPAARAMVSAVGWTLGTPPSLRAARERVGA